MLSTHFIRLYTSSSAISRPSLLYVVSANTSTFGSIFSLASDLWSCVSDESGCARCGCWHRTIGTGFVSRCMKLKRERKKRGFYLIIESTFSMKRGTKSHTQFSQQKYVVLVMLRWPLCCLSTAITDWFFMFGWGFELLFHSSMRSTITTITFETTRERATW